MSRWTGVVTNGGAALLNEWARGGTLRIHSAASGDGTAPEAALLAQSAISGTRRAASVAGYREIRGGTQIRLQIAAPQAEGYALHQLGIWAALDGGEPVLLAIYQTEEGIPIPSGADSPDFLYTFYAAIALDNMENLEIIVDTQAAVSIDTLQDAIDRLKLEIMRNELTLPLETDTREQLLTDKGTPILAVYRPDRSTSILAALEALDRRLSGQIGQVAADCTAHTGSAKQYAVTAAQAYTDGRIAAVLRQMEADAGSVAGQIAAAKQEAIVAASADAAAQVGAHNAAAASHADFLRVAENTPIPD